MAEITPAHAQKRMAILKQRRAELEERRAGIMQALDQCNAELNVMQGQIAECNFWLEAARAERITDDEGPTQ